MKKLFQFALIAAIIFVLPSQTQAPKELTVKLSLGEWQNIMDCLDKSNAPHLQVQAATQSLLTQLQKQLADTTKKK